MHMHMHRLCRKEGRSWCLGGVHVKMHAYIHMRQNNEVAVGERVRKVEKTTIKKE
jgi:hypothetical protein